jgi:hypothetical protein
LCSVAEAFQSSHQPLRKRALVQPTFVISSNLFQVCGYSQYVHLFTLIVKPSRLLRPCRNSSNQTLASHRGGSSSRQGSMWGLWWTKRHCGGFSPSTSVSPANHSTSFSIIIITRGWHNRPIGGRSAGWTQLDSTPHYINLEKTNRLVWR